MGSLDFLANVMASHHYVTSAEAVERAASLWRGHPPTDRSDITRAFAERPEMFTPEEGHTGGEASVGGVDGVDVRPAWPTGFVSPEGSASAPAHTERAKTLQKVRDLIAVAVGHADDNEARASAVIACTLIVEHDLLKSE